MAALDQLAEAPERRVLLAGGDADLDRVGELGVRLVLVRLERLLEPEDAELLEPAGDADRLLRIGARSRGPASIRIVTPSPPASQAAAASSRSLAGIRPERAPAELDGGEALVAQRADALARPRPVVSGISIEA